MSSAFFETPFEFLFNRKTESDQCHHRDAVECEQGSQCFYLRLDLLNLAVQNLAEVAEVALLLVQLLDDPLKHSLEARVVDRDREHLLEVERARDLNLLLRHNAMLVTLKTNYFK